jgi:hypothetical protein
MRRPLTRERALALCRDADVIVEYRAGGLSSTVPLTPDCPFYPGTGPYDYSSFRYYLLDDTGLEIGSGTSGGIIADDPTPPPPRTPDPPRPRVRGRFKVTEAKCGDEVGLEITGEHIPDGETATADLKTIDGDRALESVSAPFGTDLKWNCKKPAEGHWDAPEVYFNASAAGETARSSNEFKFKKWANVAREVKTIAMVSGTFGWTGKFAIEFRDGKLRVHTTVKLNNRLGARPAAGAAPATWPAIGPAVSAADKAAMKTDIQGKLSGKWLLHRQDCKRLAACDCDNDFRCCKIKVRVTIDFVEAGAMHTVDLWQGAGRADSGNWTRVKTRANSYAHETGHLLGWFDEYVGGATGPAPRWVTPNANVVMNTGLRVPFTYYWDFRDWMNSKTGERWKRMR